MSDGIFGTKLADATFVVGNVSGQLADHPFPRGFVLQAPVGNTDPIYLRGVEQGAAVVFQGPEIQPGGGAGFNLTNTNQLCAISANPDQRLNAFAVKQ